VPAGGGLLSASTRPSGYAAARLRRGALRTEQERAGGAGSRSEELRRAGRRYRPALVPRARAADTLNHPASSHGPRTSDPRLAPRSLWHFTFPDTLPRCLPERVDESPICRICAPRCRKITLEKS